MFFVCVGSRQAFSSHFFSFLRPETKMNRLSLVVLLLAALAACGALGQEISSMAPSPQREQPRGRRGGF